MDFRLTIAALGLLTACAATGDDTIPAVGSDTCDARAQRSLIGRTVDDRASLTLAAPKVRLIDPGDAVTQDHQPDRLNIEFDEAGRITRVYCG